MIPRTYRWTLAALMLVPLAASALLLACPCLTTALVACALALTTGAIGAVAVWKIFTA